MASPISGVSITIAFGVFAGAGSAAANALPTPCGRILGPTVHWNGQALHHYVVGAFHGTTAAATPTGWCTTRDARRPSLRGSSKANRSTRSA